MGNKFVIALIILSVVAAGFALMERYQVEQQNRTVEMVIDGQLYQELFEEKGVDKQLLEDFRELGVTSVAVLQKRLKDLDPSRAQLLMAEDIFGLNSLTGFLPPLLEDFQLSGDSAVLIVEDEALQEQVKTRAEFWEEQYKAQTREREGKLLVHFPLWRERMEEITIGFDHQQLAEFEEQGLRVIPRFKNRREINPLTWQTMEEFAGKTLIFDGDEVLGYPDQLQQTARTMWASNITFGMIEPFIADQEGATELGSSLNYHLVRVHSIQEEEMEKYSLTEVAQRYLRAVKERDVRVLYIKPFLEPAESGADLYALNRDLIGDIAGGLRSTGFDIDVARPFRLFSGTFPFIIVISLGIMAAGLLLLEYLLDKKLGVFKWLLLIILLSGEYLLIRLTGLMLVRKLLALSAAVVFPSLAIISQLLAPPRIKRWLPRFIGTTLISVAGGLLVAGMLTHTSFMVKIDQFRGVKLAFVLPLMLVSFYYLKYFFGSPGQTMYEKLVQALNLKIAVKHVVLLGILGIAGILYVGRSGNFSLLPVPDLEVTVRRVLEEILYIRPRFKSFLIGHPLLVIALGLRERLQANVLLYPLVILGAVGQITILNTFSHIHTPLMASLLRVTHGVWLGLIPGLIGLYLCRLFLKPVTRGGSDING